MDTMPRDQLAGSGPKYLRLERLIRERIDRGELAAGVRLPTVRDLAWQMGVTPGTVSRAYAALTNNGYLTAKVGRGTFVAARGATEPPYLIADTVRGETNLRSSVIPDVGQARAIGAAMTRAASDLTATAMEYPRRADDLPVINLYLGMLDRVRIGPAWAEDVILSAGAQHALLIATQSLLRGARRTVIVEELTYPGFRNAAQLAQARVVSIPTDGEGPDPAALDAACAQYGPAVFITSTRVNNPLLTRTSPERADRIVRIARARDLHLVDDDTFALGSDGAPGLRAMAPERGWHIASLSKSISPTLRFGAVIAPKGWGGRALSVAQQQLYGMSGLVLGTVRELIESGDAARISEEVMAHCARSVGLAREILGDAIVSDTRVPFVWLPLPSGWRASSFTTACAGQGILVKPADLFAPADGGAPNAVRVYLNGRLDPAALRDVLSTIAELLARPQADVSA